MPGPAGNMSQYFEPVSTAFHAHVAFGSLWKVEPLRRGPMIIQRQSGRCSPSTLKRSSPKHVGLQYAASWECGGAVISMFVFSAKARSKRYKGDSSALRRIYDMYVVMGQSTASARNLVCGNLSSRYSGVQVP